MLFQVANVLMEKLLVLEENVHKLNTNAQLKLLAHQITLFALIYHAHKNLEIVLKIYVMLDNIIATTENVLIVKKNVQLDQYVLMNIQSFVLIITVFKT